MEPKSTTKAKKITPEARRCFERHFFQNFQLKTWKTIKFLQREYDFQESEFQEKPPEITFFGFMLAPFSTRNVKKHPRETHLKIGIDFSWFGSLFGSRNWPQIVKKSSWKSPCKKTAQKILGAARRWTFEKNQPSAVECASGSKKAPKSDPGPKKEPSENNSFFYLFFCLDSGTLLAPQINQKSPKNVKKHASEARFLFRACFFQFRTSNLEKTYYSFSGSTISRMPYFGKIPQKSNFLFCFSFKKVAKMQKDRLRQRTLKLFFLMISGLFCPPRNH